MLRGVKDMRNSTKVLGALLISIFLVSCGRNFQGTFQGPEQAQLGSGLGSGFGGYNPYCDQPYGIATLTLTESRGNVTGTYSSACYNGTIQGRSDGGQLTNAFLILNPIQNQQSGVGGGFGSSSCGTYTGSLNENNRVLTGQFTNTQGGAFFNPACPQVLAINFTRLSK